MQLLRFWLGTHEPAWLTQMEVPLMVSRRRLVRRRQLPRARGPWFQDSGGFTELLMHGSWDGLSARQYAAEIRRHAAEIGQLAHAAPMDWMCEPAMLKRTGLTVEQHQARTVANYLELLGLAPELPWVPVLQGWAMADYLRHVAQYTAAGVDLLAAPLVGVGTMCRRQGTREALQVLTALSGLGLKLHAFGYKTRGLALAAPVLASADSMAWSYAARREAPLAGCTHKNCANCQRYALRWRGEVERLIAAAASRPVQLALAM